MRPAPDTAHESSPRTLPLDARALPLDSRVIPLDPRGLSQVRFRQILERLLLLSGPPQGPQPSLAFAVSEASICPRFESALHWISRPCLIGPGGRRSAHLYLGAWAQCGFHRPQITSWSGVLAATCPWEHAQEGGLEAFLFHSEQLLLLRPEP